MTLHGLPKIFLRNSVPVDAAKNYVDDYELTMAYDYEWDAAAKKINIIEKPWVVNDDQGVPSYSLQAPAVAVSLIKQLVKALGI
jgi:hypothetical protein